MPNEEAQTCDAYNGSDNGQPNLLNRSCYVNNHYERITVHMSFQIQDVGIDAPERPWGSSLTKFTSV